MRFFISLVLVFSLYAKVIDKIEILVNNTPITSYDIYKTQKQLRVDKDQAIAYLIDQTIIQTAIKNRDIYVDDFDIDNAMRNIALKNHMSLFEFKNYLLQRGELESFKEKLKQDLEKQKLIESLNVRISKKEVEKYYKTYKEEFLRPTTIQTTQYSSNDKQKLIKVIKNPLMIPNGVDVQDKTFNIKDTNQRLMGFLSSFDEKSFTPIITIDGKYRTFYIIKKSDVKLLPLEEVGGEIFQKLLKQKQDKALQDLIAKLKAKADIIILK
jgi:parvulin-like peptidyl-prolyl isomerase